MIEEISFYYSEESYVFLSTKKENRVRAALVCDLDNPRISYILENYQRRNIRKPMPFEIASLAQDSKHFAESQIIYEKEPFSNVLDDQEKTQAPSQHNIIEQLQEKAIQCQSLLNNCILQVKDLGNSLIYRQLEQVQTYYQNSIVQLTKIQNQLQSDKVTDKNDDYLCQKQQRFFSQHNSDDNDQSQQIKMQIAYNPQVLENMLKRIKKEAYSQTKIETHCTRSIFRGNSRFTELQDFRTSLQQIPLMGGTSPCLRGFNAKTPIFFAKEAVSPDKQIQKTGPNEQLSQGALNFLMQLKKTKSIEAKNHSMKLDSKNKIKQRGQTHNQKRPAIPTCL